MWRTSTISAIAGAALAAGCVQEMADQPKLEPFEGAELFTDGLGARRPVAGTVARGQLREDSQLYEGKVAGDAGVAELCDTFPRPVTAATLRRGRERYDIYCSPCHARTGDGDGLIVQRGFRRPPSLHEERLRQIPVGHLYDVIRRGLGAMPAYGPRIPVEDRWAIVAYVRALQLSRHAHVSLLSAEERRRLEEAR